VLNKQIRKEREKNFNTTQQPPPKTKKRQRFVTSGTIFIPIQNTKHRQCHLQRLTFLKQRQVQWLGA